MAIKHLDFLNEILEFEQIFLTKLNDKNALNSQIQNYITQNNIDTNNIQNKIDALNKKISNEINGTNKDGKNGAGKSFIALKTLITEKKLLDQLKEKNLNVGNIDSNHKTAFLKTKIVSAFLNRMTNGDLKTNNLDKKNKFKDNFEQYLKDNYLNFDFNENEIDDLKEKTEKLCEAAYYLNPVQSKLSGLGYEIISWSLASSALSSIGLITKLVNKQELKIEEAKSIAKLLNTIFQTITDTYNKNKKENQKNLDEIINLIIRNFKNFNDEMQIFDNRIFPFNVLEKILNNLKLYNKAITKNENTDDICNNILNNLKIITDDQITNYSTEEKQNELVSHYYPLLVKEIVIDGISNNILTEANNDNEEEIDDQFEDALENQEENTELTIITNAIEVAENNINNPFLGLFYNDQNNENNEEFEDAIESMQNSNDNLTTTNNTNKNRWDNINLSEIADELPGVTGVTDSLLKTDQTQITAATSNTEQQPIAVKSTTENNELKNKENWFTRFINFFKSESKNKNYNQTEPTLKQSTISVQTSKPKTTTNPNKSFKLEFDTTKPNGYFTFKEYSLLKHVSSKLSNSSIVKAIKEALSGTTRY